MKHTSHKIFRERLAVVVLATAALGCQSPTDRAGANPVPAEHPSVKESPSVLSNLFSRGQTVEVSPGATVKVRTTASLSTKTHKPGDEFSATLVEPVMAGEKLVAARGSEVRGVVAESDPGGRVKGLAYLSLRLTRLHAVNGEMVDIETDPVARQAKSTKKKDAAKIGIGSGIGAAVGAIAGGGKGAAVGAAAGGGAGTGVVLATKGAPVTIPSETVLTFRIASPVEVTLDS